MTFGASTMDRAKRMNLRLGNGDEILGESLYTQPGLRGHLVYPGLNGDREGEFCTNLDTFDVKGKVVMCLPGLIETEQKADVVEQAGGIAVVLLSSQMAGSIIVDVPDTVFLTIAVNYPNSLKLVEYVNQSITPPRAARVELVPVGTITGVTPTPAVPHFSSRGPSIMNGGILKPDILGPSVNVLAAKNNSASGFVLLSGTSMATPHLSGITRHGHVNPAGAMDPGLVYDLQFEDYIRYLCGLRYSDKEILQTASMSVDCNQFGRIEQEQLNYPSIAVTLSYSITRKVIKRTVTNVRPEPTSYTAEVSLTA
ncbi:hypothetical protein Taro_033352 [Colocasia esculenta]|uniref:Uncharacterized protein n=1 Tax=Colocasia esculenta TaxID=4460 RepID=A0A843W8T1_COLES|nr:hypothetical protein [Colocasia esculenta]